MKAAFAIATAGLVWSTGLADCEPPAAAQGHMVRAATPKELRRAAFNALQRPVSLDVRDTKLEDVLAYIETVSGATFAPAWLDGGASAGLEREARITIKVENVAAVSLLERVLEKAAGQQPGSNTWQLTDEGLVEVGPKSRLNASAVLKVYDVNDLLYEIPNFADAPQLDLDSVLNQGQGGGTGSIFQGTEQAAQGDRQTREAKVRALMEVIVSTIEHEQWSDNGGDGASIREQNGMLLIKAPDYIHRQVGGYDF